MRVAFVWGFNMGCKSEVSRLTAAEANTDPPPSMLSSNDLNQHLSNSPLPHFLYRSSLLLYTTPSTVVVTENSPFYCSLSVSFSISMQR